MRSSITLRATDTRRREGTRVPLGLRGVPACIGASSCSGPYIRRHLTETQAPPVTSSPRRRTRAKHATCTRGRANGVRRCPTRGRFPRAARRLPRGPVARPAPAWATHGMWAGAPSGRDAETGNASSVNAVRFTVSADDQRLPETANSKDVLSWLNGFAS